MDAGLDDHVSGRDLPAVSLYDRGNMDGNGSLTMSLGEQVVVDPNWALTVATRLRGYRYVLYPEFSGVWGTVSTELARYDAFLGTDAFVTAFAGAGWGTSQSYGAFVTLEHPLWDVLTASMDSGGYRYGDSTVGIQEGAWLEGSLRHRWGPLSAWLQTSWTQRWYDTGLLEGQGSAGLTLGWTLWQGADLRATAEHVLIRASDTTRSYAGNLFSLGALYSFW